MVEMPVMEVMQEIGQSASSFDLKRNIPLGFNFAANDSQTTLPQSLMMLGIILS